MIVFCMTVIPVLLQFVEVWRPLSRLSAQLHSLPTRTEGFWGNYVIAFEISVRNIAESQASVHCLRYDTSITTWDEQDWCSFFAVYLMYCWLRCCYTWCHMFMLPQGVEKNSNKSALCCVHTYMILCVILKGSWLSKGIDIMND